MKLRYIFSNQWRVIRPLGIARKQFIRNYIKASIQDLNHICYDLRHNLSEKMGKKSPLINQDLRNQLTQSHHDTNKIKISFYGAARRKRNHCCHLDVFLQPLLKHTNHLDSIEVLLAIDPDDYLHYFIDLKKKYEPYFQFKIFITEKRLGYENLHRYDTILFNELAPHTKMLCDFSDDCQIVLPKFDDFLLEIDKKHPDNIYFIHTQLSDREAYLGDVSQHPSLLFWILQTKSPASYFPIMSRKVLNIAQTYASQNDHAKEWSPIANSWICDCYIDILATYVKRFGMDRIYSLDMIYMDPGKPSAFRYVDKKYSLTPNHLAFIKMLNSDSLRYLSGLAETIAHHAAKN